MNITSHNQSGGITAGTVDIKSLNQNNTSKKVSPKEKWYNNHWIVTIIGGTVGGIMLFFILNHLV